jgi:large subunit ribosomal protein L22
MERPMNTAGNDRVVQKSIEEFISHTDKPRTPISRIKLVRTKGDNPTVSVLVHTSRPQILRPEAPAIASALQEEFGAKREVKVEIIAEARSVAKFIRSSPRKARLVIDAIKGKRVSEALAVLKFVPNHAAHSIAKVLSSAAANAQDGWGALPEELKVANIIADGGPTLKRVNARAQGRAYRILKRTTHLTVVLTEMPAPITKRRVQGKVKKKPTPITTIIKKKPETKPAKTEQIEETTPEVEQTTPVVEATSEAQAPEAAESVEHTAAETAPVAETATEGSAEEAHPEAEATEAPATEEAPASDAPATEAEG